MRIYESESNTLNNSIHKIESPEIINFQYSINVKQIVFIKISDIEISNKNV